MSNGEILTRLQAMFDQCDVRHCEMANKDNCAKCQYAISAVREMMAEQNNQKNIIDSMLDILTKRNRQISDMYAKLQQVKRHVG